MLAIILIARGISSETFMPSNLQASILNSSNTISDTLKIEDQKILDLNFGSMVEVYRFTLSMSEAYTLRYLNFEVNTQDIQVEDWAVYEVTNGVIDYNTKVGQSEEYNLGKLKLRFFSKRSYGYFGEGRQEFALTAKIKRIGENPSLQIKASDEVDWIKGDTKRPWGALDK